MAERLLKIVVRTPHETVLETEARALRVRTETGQVGLRPQVEGQVLAIEAGVALVRQADGSETFIGNAGGLLLCDGETATLLTPLAVVGKDEEAIAAELDRVLTLPSSEMEARSMLTRLESEIVNELQEEPRAVLRGREGG